MSLDDKIAAALELQQEGRLDEALNCCLPLLAQDMADFRLHFLLGMLYQQRDQTSLAITHFTKATELYPELASAHYNLGVLHYGEGQMESAVAAYQQAAELLPNDPDIFFNLALTLKNMRRFDEAKTHYQWAIDLNPQDADAHYNLGVLLRQMDQPADAASAFGAAVDLAPGYLAAHKHLAALHHLLGNREEALASYRKILELDPANDSARHMIAALGGESPADSPLSYVQELFDSFSAEYETTMGEKLECAVEKKLRQLLDHHAKGRSFAKGLDMGCGTGLSGIAFKERISHFTGFDLSAGMLARAREKDIYDDLQQDDIIGFLEKSEETFDFFLAADVFVYLGDLEPVFALVRSKARTNAHFLFSTEKCAERFVLQQSGRYAHGENYIRKIALKYGFTVADHTQAELRKEKGEWIKGNLYLLRATP